MTAIDPVTIVIKECITIASTMRKTTKATGVVAMLGAGSDIFHNEDAIKNNDPLVSGFIQLKLMLNSTKSLDDVDTLTLLQPFLLVISTSTTSGYITSLALDSIFKFLKYDLLHGKNCTQALTQLVTSLTHCRFEASEQMSDDSVLLKVVKLLDMILTSELGDVLSDSIVTEVLQIVLPLACNKRRTEILRSAAQLAMVSITIRIFSKLESMKPTEGVFINDESFVKELNDDNLAATPDVEEQPMPVIADVDSPYGLTLIVEYLGILISLITPENQHKHNESTKVFALLLLNTAVELAGDKFLLHPRLFMLVSDSILKHTLQIVTAVDKVPVLQGALQLFTTICLTLGENLNAQIELTLQTIMQALQSERLPAAKELLIEQISLLWSRQPSFFTDLFMSYDCRLDKSDLAVEFLQFLTKNALPESAVTSTENVPPICLEGIVCMVDDVHRHLGEQTSSKKHPLLQDKDHKVEFINCSELFNSKPKDGIKEFIAKGFLSSDKPKEIAKFLNSKGRLNKKMIGEYLAKPDHLEILKEFIGLFDFKDLRVDEALRVLLTSFRLPGESQQIERIVETFSSIYVDCQKYNPEKAEQDIEGDLETVQPDAESVFVLSYSVIMLNTDLHNPQVKKHMTFDDYTYNLRGCCNEKDFPMWYLDKIFVSIRDKEIVMPEEHHGSAQWFNDAWNNAVSSGISKPEAGKKVDICLSQFDERIFNAVGQQIVDTFFSIFNVASDDTVSNKMLSCIVECCQIAEKYNRELYDNIISRLVPKFEGEDISVTQITDYVTVSKVSMAIGNSHKFQTQLRTLFDIIRTTEVKNWDAIVDLVIILQQAQLIPSDPRPSADYVLQKDQLKKSLFSSFASYLKGDEEPTDEEIEISLLAQESVKQDNILTALLSQNGEALVCALEKKLTGEESQQLFVLGLLSKLQASIVENFTSSDFSAMAQTKLVSLKLASNPSSTVVESICEDILSHPTLPPLLDTLVTLEHTGPQYWKLLRKYASEPAHTALVFQHVDKCKDFMTLLGLLDEISSVGASGKKNIVEVSQKSIQYTAQLKANSREQTMAQLQALAHQCMNPCTTLSKQAWDSLYATEASIDVIIAGLASLIAQFPKKQMLEYLTNIYLDDVSNEAAYLQIMDVFNPYSEEVEKELTELIAKRKRLLAKEESKEEAKEEAKEESKQDETSE